jgi:uncharacterized coiled-coil protein SlyX
MTMTSQSWTSGLAGAQPPVAAPPATEGLTGEDPAGPLLPDASLDASVRSLQEDLALLHADQERALGTVNGNLVQLGEEIGAVRAQLAALAEPLLAAQGLSAEHVSHVSTERERAEVEARFERLERQVSLLVRGLDSVDTLRYQSDVHTRALARLTDLLGEVVRPRPIEGLEALQKAVATLEAGQRRQSRAQLVGFALLGVGLLPGVGALAWLAISNLAL